MSDINDIKNEVINILLKEKEKEYYCHIQFVTEIGNKLAKQYNANPKIVELSCLLHDIGRDKELESEEHADASVRISKSLLREAPLNEEELTFIFNCIKNHNADNPVETIEEKIVITADSASKVEYHEAFMLLCKKTTYQERLVWGQKYLDKGFKKIQLPEYKEFLLQKYTAIHSIYEKVSARL